MPSVKILARKKREVDKIKIQLESALVGILVSYKGINVENDTILRRKMRESNVWYKVIKNTLLKRAFDLANISGMDEFLSGSTAVVIDKNSYSNAPKIICDFEKKHEYFTIKVGFVKDRRIDANEVKVLAKLPTREELISQMLRGLNAPITGLVIVSNGIIRSFAIVINAIKTQREAS